MSELFLAEKERYREQWERITRILKQHRKRYDNKTDVIEEALNLLENHLSNLDDKH